MRDKSLQGIAIGFGQQPMGNKPDQYERTLTLNVIEHPEKSLYDTIAPPQTDIIEIGYSQIEYIEFCSWKRRDIIS